MFGQFSKNWERKDDREEDDGAVSGGMGGDGRKGVAGRVEDGART